MFFVIKSYKVKNHRMSKKILSIIRFLFLQFILLFGMSSCLKHPDEIQYCKNCNIESVETISIKNKPGWIIYNKNFNKYIIDVIQCENPTLYVPCQLPDYYQPRELDTVIFNGTIIKDPYLTSDSIPITYYCVRIDTIALHKNFPDPGTLPQGLKGSWVEINSKIDTIEFSNKFKILNGEIWLKNCAGNTTFFPYEISNDSIHISDALSSVWELAEGKNYYFNFDSLRLIIQIGHFTFRLSTNDSILTFRKIQ